MKLLFSFIVCFWFQFSLGQNFYLKIKGASEQEHKTIDSITYALKHPSVASILAEQKRFESKLTNIGFFDWLLIEQKKVNDSSFVFQYRLGNLVQTNTIYTGKLLSLIHISEPTRPY